jgi:hypothetical protein
MLVGCLQASFEASGAFSNYAGAQYVRNLFLSAPILPTNQWLVKMKRYTDVLPNGPRVRGRIESTA